MGDPGQPNHATADDYKFIFEDHRVGAKILDELVRRFSRPPVCDGGIDAVLKTYKNAGAREVLDFILLRINQANGVKDDDQD